MYSMNRTSSRCCLPNSSRSTTSSSLKPRITTVLILVPGNPAAVPRRSPPAPRRVGRSARRRSSVRVGAVEAHRHPVEARRSKRRRMPAKEDPVRRQRDVGEARSDAAGARRARKIVPQQRLATGQPELCDAEPSEDIRRAVDLLERAGWIREEARCIRPRACSTGSACCTGR